jgi:multiple sugar transport system permease protein
MKQSKYAAWFFIGPAMLTVGIFAFYPIVRTIILSFYQKNLDTGLTARFAGLQNFRAIFYDFHFFAVLKNTAVLTVCCVSLEIVLGLLFALLMHRKFAGRGAARTSLLVPWALPTAIMALGWMWIFNDVYGVFNDILLRLHLIDHNVAWLAKPSTALLALVIADVWKTTPFVYVIILTGLQGIPYQVYEAAGIDGATRLRAFFHITLPLLKPSILMAAALRGIQTFGIFDLVYILTGGGPGGSTETVAIYIYQTCMRYLDFGYGAALVVATFFMVAVITVAGYILLNRKKKVSYA